MNTKALMMVCLWMLASSVPAKAAESGAPALKTKPVAISLFKNGLGFVAREGEIPIGQSALVIENLPPPALGTFWVYSPGNEVTIKDLVAYPSEATEQLEAISVAEILGANLGQTVDLRLGEKETVRAKILSVARDRVTETPVDPSRSQYNPYVPPVESSSLVLLQIGGGTMAVNKSAVQQISSPNGPLKTSFERKKRTAGLRLNAQNVTGKGRVMVLYLAKGITWSPSCAIDITDPQKARVTAKAEIIDEIEDLENVPVNFVTGFPNLKFADVIDPMALRGDLAAFLTGLTNPSRADNYLDNRAVLMRQAALADRDEEAFPTYATAPQEGQTREELFFYEQRGVSLKKGERGYYPLYTTEVPYQHVYEWKIGDVLDEQGQYRNPNATEPEKTEDVWHGIRLTNTGSVPWTTAPAVTMQSGQILGQDLIYYTSPGSKTTVRITKAVDVKAEQVENEVQRTRNAANFYGSSYDLVEVRGKLTASNYKNKAITLTISKELSGEVLKTEPAAKVEQTARGLKKVNPKSMLTWELPVKSRDKVEIVYGYKIYVRD